MRKPVFTKVDQLSPGTGGHTLTVKVVTSSMVLKKGHPDVPQLRQMRIAECLVGDEAGVIVSLLGTNKVVFPRPIGDRFSEISMPLLMSLAAAVDLMRPDATVILQNTKIDMFKGSMRLAVDKWGQIDVTEPADFAVKKDNNLSLLEYEMVNVVKE